MVDRTRAVRNSLVQMAATGLVALCLGVTVPRAADAQKTALDSTTAEAILSAAGGDSLIHRMTAGWKQSKRIFATDAFTALVLRRAAPATFGMMVEVSSSRVWCRESSPGDTVGVRYTVSVEMVSTDSAHLSAGGGCLGFVDGGPSAVGGIELVYLARSNGIWRAKPERVYLEH